MLDDAGRVLFAGDVARKLTAHAGYEAFARFSADGDVVYHLRIKEKDVPPVPPFPIKK